MGRWDTALAGHPQRPVIEQASAQLACFATTSSDHDDWRLIDEHPQGSAGSGGACFRPPRNGPARFTGVGSARQCFRAEIFSWAKSLLRR